MTSFSPHPRLRAVGTALAALIFGLCAANSAYAVDRAAGPIWNDGDAQRKCPRVCVGAERWNGQWRTVVAGRQSVCGCQLPAPMPPPPPAPPQAAPAPAPPTPGGVPAVVMRPGPAMAPGPRVMPRMGPSPEMVTPPPPPPVWIKVKRLRHRRHADKVCASACAKAALGPWTGAFRKRHKGNKGACECIVPPPVPPQLPRGAAAGRYAPSGPVAVDPAGPSPRYAPPPPPGPPPPPPNALPPPAAPQPPAAPAKHPKVGHDGCARASQRCICGNTKRRGRCRLGPHKAGLYCRCD